MQKGSKRAIKKYVVRAETADAIDMMMTDARLADGVVKRGLALWVMSVVTSPAPQA